jgi:hypothetical protein
MENSRVRGAINIKHSKKKKKKKPYISRTKHHYDLRKNINSMSQHSNKFSRFPQFP